MATFGIASTFDNAGQLVASQRYSDAVLGPCVIGTSPHLVPFPSLE